MVEPEKYDLGQPKYLKNKQKTATEDEDKPDTKTESEEDDKLLVSIEKKFLHT